MADLCLKHGIKLLAYGTVAGGLLTERWLGKPEPDWGELETWSRLHEPVADALEKPLVAQETRRRVALVSRLAHLQKFVQA